MKTTGIADTANFGPEREFFVFDEVPSELGIDKAGYYGGLGRGPLELRQARARLHGARQGGLLLAGPCTTRSPTCAPRWSLTLSGRHPVRVPPSRGARRLRDRPPLSDADAHGGPGRDLQVRRRERRPGGRQDRDVHAEADLRRQRLGDAQPLQPSGRKARRSWRTSRLRGPLTACVLRRRLLMRAQRCWPSARRRRTPTGGWCRATRRRSTSSTPQRNRSAAIRSPCTQLAEGEARRVPPAGRVSQPVSRLLGDADGRPRWYRERPGPRRAGRTSTPSRIPPSASPVPAPPEALDALDLDHVPHARRASARTSSERGSSTRGRTKWTSSALAAPGRVRPLLRRLSHWLLWAGSSALSLRLAAGEQVGLPATGIIGGRA